MNVQVSEDKRRALAVELMRAALAMLDEVGPTRAAATLSLAIELTGQVAPKLLD